MNKFILLFSLGAACILMNPQTAKAQEPTSLSLTAPALLPGTHDKEGDQEIVDITYKLYEAMDGITKAQDGNIEPVTKYLDKDFMAVRHITDVAGKQTRSELNLDGYRRQLSYLSSFTGLTTTYKIDNINFVRTYETMAVVNYSLYITASLNGEEVLKFRSIVTNYMRRGEDKQWKVLESNGLNIYREQEVGICPVAFSKASKDGTQYTATVISPAGTSFRTDVVNLTFKGAEGKTIISAGQSAWLLDGTTLTCVKDKGKVVNVRIGTANTRIECVNLILSQHLFSDRCLSFKTLEK
jgi:hypothetical protein